MHSIKIKHLSMQDLLAHILKVFGITAIRYIIIAGGAFLIFYKLFPRHVARLKIQKRQAKKADFLREAGYSLLSSLVFAVIATLVLYTSFVHHTLVYHHLHGYPLWWIPVSAVLALVVHDTYFYWMHRLLHHKRLYRHTHLAHHKSINPSPLASYSFHLLEAVAEGGIILVVSMVLPMHPLSMMLFIVSGFVINVYGHLGYELMPRGFRHSFLFGILNTSVHHNLHHSRFKGNYGLYFRIWDRLMGTEHPDYVKDYDRVQAQRFGTGKNSQEENAMADHTTPELLQKAGQA